MTGIFIPRFAKTPRKNLPNRLEMKYEATMFKVTPSQHANSISMNGVLSARDAAMIKTGVTGKVVHDNTGLPVRCLYPGGRGGAEQISSMIACGEVDMLLFFRDPVGARPDEPNAVNLLRLCDMHTIPVATNIATAEVLIHGLERGDLAWIELQRDHR